MIKENLGRPSVGETESLITGKTESGFLGENKEILGPQLFWVIFRGSLGYCKGAILITQRDWIRKALSCKGPENSRSTDTPDGHQAIGGFPRNERTNLTAKLLEERGGRLKRCLGFRVYELLTWFTATYPWKRESQPCLGFRTWTFNAVHCDASLGVGNPHDGHQTLRCLGFRGCERLTEFTATLALGIEQRQ